MPRALKAQRDAHHAPLLAERGVETRAYFYPPVHEQQLFRHYADRPLPVTETLARRVMTLPFFTTMTAAEMDTSPTPSRAARRWACRPPRDRGAWR